MDRDAPVKAYYQWEVVGIDTLVSFPDSIAASHTLVREGIGRMYIYHALPEPWRRFLLSLLLTL